MRKLVGLALLLFGGACVSVDTLEGSELPWTSVERIQPGTTTRSQVLDWLGAPQNFANPTELGEFLAGQGIESETYSRYPFADVFVYQLTRGHLRGFFALFYNRFELKVDQDLVFILFDDSDRVMHLGIRRAPGAK
jgi:hypothetical protein